mmetsp:Transcript_19468/g.42578  ORF Transcript_19468/g.42578 Transcript_19468/m.42578 type:complete len:125 (-) Transcript_19468:144-518(-)
MASSVESLQAERRERCQADTEEQHEGFGDNRASDGGAAYGEGARDVTAALAPGILARRRARPAEAEARLPGLFRAPLARRSQRTGEQQSAHHGSLDDAPGEQRPARTEGGTCVTRSPQTTGLFR